MSTAFTADPALDLVLERTVPVPPEKVWAAWTTPELIKQWFTPVPWRTTEAVVELWPGGLFRTVMEGPDGERNEGNGCVLEAVENRRLVWTGALGRGFRPNSAEVGMLFTAVIAIEPDGDGGTRYTATAIHGNPDDAKTHDEMGFHVGWGLALDQLVALMSSSDA